MFAVILTKNNTLQIDEANRSNHPYLLYPLTVSGVAYLLRLRPISIYASCSAFWTDELVEFNMSAYGPITCAAATPSGCLVVGLHAGFLDCFQLGTLDPTAPGLMFKRQNDVFYHLGAYMIDDSMV